MGSIPRRGKKSIQTNSLLQEEISTKKILASPSVRQKHRYEHNVYGHKKRFEPRAAFSETEMLPYSKDNSLIFLGRKETNFGQKFFIESEKTQAAAQRFNLKLRNHFNFFFLFSF